MSTPAKEFRMGSIPEHKNCRNGSVKPRSIKLVAKLKGSRQSAKYTVLPVKDL